MPDSEHKKRRAKDKVNALYLAQKAKQARKQEREQRRQRRRNVGGEPSPEEDTPAQALVRRYCEWEPYPALWVPPYTAYGDYAGSFVERSNAEVFKETFPEVCIEAHGGLGTVWVGFLHDEISFLSEEQLEQLEEMLRSLDDYPVLDEDKMSEMEEEAKQDYWESDGRAELRKELIERAGYNVLAHLGAVYAPDDALDTWFSEGDLYDLLQIEEGANVYFDAEKAAKALDLMPGLWAEDQPQIQEAEFRAFQRDLSSFLGLVQKVKGAPYVAQLHRLSDVHLFKIFKRLEGDVSEGGLWDLDNDRQEQPSDNLSLNTRAVEEALHGLSDNAIEASRPEDPRQMQWTLFKGEHMKVQDSVSDLLEGFKEAKQRFIAAGASPEEAAAVLTQFKQLKARRMLASDENDIDTYQDFETLRTFVQQASERTRSPSAKTRSFQVRDDTTLIHDDEDVTILVPHTEEASQFYGKGTKWCTSGEANCQFKNYRKSLNKQYIFIYKNRPSSDPDYKMCLTRGISGQYQGHDARDDTVPESEWKARSGFDPSAFGPWQVHELPPEDRWNYAQKTGMAFGDFVRTIDAATWAALGQRVPVLKHEWLSHAQAEGEEASEEAWEAFWREVLTDALEEPPDREFLDHVQHYLQLSEHLDSASALATLLLTEGLKPGQAKRWLTAKAQPRRELRRARSEKG